MPGSLTDEEKKDLDPILAYLLEFNETHPIEYRGRKLIPPGGLEEMLRSYKKFHLNREEELETEPEKDITPTTQEELYKLLD